jgi:SOUL heme-binding protein
MGSVFGKQTVAEPAFEVLFSKNMKSDVPQNATMSYEIRSYGKRFVAEATSTVDGAEEGSGKHGMEQNNLFYSLAGYIGVFGTPENEGGNSIRA